MFLFQFKGANKSVPGNVIHKNVIDNTEGLTEMRVPHTLEKETAATVNDEAPTTIEDSPTEIKEKEKKKELSEMAVGKETETEKVGSKAVDADVGMADDADDGDFDNYDEIRPVIEPSLYDSGLSSASQDRDLNSTGIGNCQ